MLRNLLSLQIGGISVINLFQVLTLIIQEKHEKDNQSLQQLKQQVYELILET